MPTEWPDYELIDFGGGRKLERLGEQVFDRPAPQADGAKKTLPDAWKQTTAKYSGAKSGDGKWRFLAGELRSPESVEIPFASSRIRGRPVSLIRIAVEPTPAGQVGLFPEQLASWQWIARQVAKSNEPLRVLNLFGYTGASTLSATAAGAEVTHVDSSKPAVAAARANAELSGLADAPIRWIVDDAMKYCRREIKRGSQYHGIILDPPTYGHGASGEEWRLVRDLPTLLELCRELTHDDRRFVVATCHTPGVGPAELAAYLSDGLFGHCGQPSKSGRLWLGTKSGRRLASGVYARWPGL